MMFWLHHGKYTMGLSLIMNGVTGGKLYTKLLYQLFILIVDRATPGLFQTWPLSRVQIGQRRKIRKRDNF